MSDFKTFMKTLSKTGYPNPNIVSIAEFVGYNIEDFLPDMMWLEGYEKTEKFLSNTLNKILDKNGVMRVDISDLAYGPSYVDIKMIYKGYDPEISEESILIKDAFVDSKIINQQGEETTLEEMYEDVGLGEMGEWDDFIGSIREEINNQFFNQSGFHLYWE